MTLSKDNQQFEQVAQKLIPQGRLIRTWKLPGGVSAQVTALEVERADGQTQKMLVRQYGAIDLKCKPYVAAHEFQLLQRLHSQKLLVPMPYYFDQSGEIFSTSYIVIEYIDGKPEFALAHVPGLIPQLAICLSRIHAVEASKMDISFLPRQEEICTRMLRERPLHVDESFREGVIRNVLETVWPFPQHNKSVLLHGDFWPGNILWRDGQLVAVIDWEDARQGDPLADLANSRLEILWASGSDAMQRFTQHYQAMTDIDFSNLPYWDLFAALRPIAKLAAWCLDEDIEETMRERHSWFVSQAFENLHISCRDVYM